MRTVRWMLATAAMGSIALVGSVTAHAATALPWPGRQAKAVAVYVSPSTANPGNQVRITAFCNSGQSASASSDLPGMPGVNLTPGFGGVTGVTTVPSKTPSGKFTITVVCGNADNGNTTLWVVDKHAPSKGPHTGGGGTVTGSSDGMGVALVGGGLAAITGAGLLLARRRRLT